MLEKPDLHNEELIVCLQAEYGLINPQVEFLPLGADQNTAVYRAVTTDEIPYFVKLRRGSFDPMSVTLPRYLSDQGIHQIIAPLVTKSGRLWARLGDFAVILYPFVEGQDGYEVNLSDHHWVELGQALKRIHSVTLPAAMAGSITREVYPSHGRETVRKFLGRAQKDTFDEPVAAKLAAFINTKCRTINDLVNRAERLAQALQANAPDFVLCHSDLHAGNILIDGKQALYIVDWDDPIFAPKERDLMYPGGNQGFRGHTSREEEALFYRGYGSVKIDQVALAYYRYERIVQDIAIYCEQIFLSDEGGKDREQSYRYLTSNFLPNNTIEIAYRSDKTLAAG
ncbi:MAG: phosphotransferase [Anaerolineaceae bacterium]